MQELQLYKEKVENELKAFFKVKIKDAKNINSEIEELVKLIEEFTLRGGKRIRAALLFYGHKAFSKNDTEDVIRVSMALELIQSYLLIHDDIIDQDTLRRGKKTFHKICENIAYKHYTQKNHIHLGMSMAIIAGDLACAFANELIEETSFKPKIKSKFSDSLNRMITAVGYGEYLDFLSVYKKNIKPKDISLIHKLKTTTYTTKGPLLLGAILGGANNKQLNLISQISEPIGEAFQIQDDILGMFGSEKKLGKDIGSDIREGKKTLLIFDALKKANDKDKKFILKHLGTKVTKKEIDRFKKIIINTGALTKSKNKADKLINESQEMLQISKIRKESKEFLIKLCIYLKDREF